MRNRRLNHSRSFSLTLDSKTSDFTCSLGAILFINRQKRSKKKKITIKKNRELEFTWKKTRIANDDYRNGEESRGAENRNSEKKRKKEAKVTCVITNHHLIANQKVLEGHPLPLTWVQIR